MIKLHLTLPLVVAAGVALAGCTTTSSGEPAPESGTTGTSAPAPPSSGDPGEEDLPFAGAPTVEHPLDTTTFQEDPCTVLTPAQGEQLNVGTAGQPIDATLGNACEWRNEETHGYVQIRFNDKSGIGLSGEYRANEQGKFAYFDPMEVDGYPAVSTDIVDRRKRGVCVVVVGVSDPVEFEIALQLSLDNVGLKDPCETAADVASMALQTMEEA